MSVNGHSNSKKLRKDMSPKVTVVLGAQWGDEGKGKVVDMLACNMDIVCRCQVRIFCVYFVALSFIVNILLLFIF